MRSVKHLISAFFIITLAVNFSGCKKDSKVKSPKIDTITTYTVTTFAGNGTEGFVNGPAGSASFNLANDVAVDKSGNVYVADVGNFVVRKISTDSIVSTFAGSGQTGYNDVQAGSAHFDGPSGLTIDNAGNIYVADAVGGTIRKITPDGYVSTIAGGDGIYIFYIPKSLTVTATGDIYVADTFHHLIQKVSPGGSVTVFAGSGNPGSADGLKTAASFNYPSAIVSDKDQNLYVADAGNNTIRKITPDGMVTTLAGNGIAGFADGKGSAALFKYPQGITIDGDNNLYVADGQNNMIRKVDLNGNVTTIAGSGSPGHQDGVGRQATFNYPLGLSTDASGNIYVADDNGRIRKITVTKKVVVN
ncbi:MAG TPA: NHL repeat-containing protein [Mucilaginibacter sp.]